MPPLRAAAALGIGYRPATDDDLPFLRFVYASTRAEEIAATGWPAEMQLQFLTQQADAQHHHYRTHYAGAEWLVIERSGTPIGRLYLHPRERDIRVVDIALVPEARGQGVATAIFEDFFCEAADAGKSVSIHVEKNNPAKRLYRRLGFVESGDQGVYDLMEWRPPN